MKYLRTIALVVIGEVGQEPIAIRSTLEYFGFRVIYYPIGRPNDFIAILSGNTLYPDISDVIICAHGKAGGIIMPILDSTIYDKEERSGDFTPEIIAQFGKLPDKIIITTGCTLGVEPMAAAFLKTGCKNFIGATNYIDGNAALIFVQTFYYKMASGETVENAYKFASKIDKETSLFKLYK